MAGVITRKLMEFEAVNRLRQLTNDLKSAGVTVEHFHEWSASQCAVRQGLVVDVYNMLSSLQKGIEIQPHALVQITPHQINSEVIKTVRMHREKLQAQMTPDQKNPADETMVARG